MSAPSIQWKDEYCRAIGVCVAAVLSMTPALGMEIESAESLYEKHEYRVELTLVLDAPLERVVDVLRDYASYPMLDPSIQEAKVLSRSADDTLLLYTKLRACSGLFCRTVKRVERVTEARFELLAEVIPEQSDVLSGRAHTLLQTLEGRTRVQYRSSFAPKFWVPSFIGRPLMVRRLREASLDLFRNVEVRARAVP
jgi:hypothetical protein